MFVKDSIHLSNQLSDILNSLSDLFETNYERSLRGADKAINEQIDLAQVT